MSSKTFLTDNRCNPNFADCTPIVCAVGFKHLYDNLPQNLAEKLRVRLTDEFGQYNYFRYRRGEFLMPPAVQNTIINIATEMGITTPVVFDGYTEKVIWSNHKIRV